MITFEYGNKPKVCPQCKRNNISEMRNDWDLADGKFMCNYAACRADDIRWYVMAPPHVEKTYTMNEVMDGKYDTFSPFMQGLFARYPQFRFHSMLGKNDDFGYVPTKDVIHFSFQIPTIRHQIGHMVEMSDLSRIIKPDWGLNNYSKQGFVPSPKGLTVALAREQRVRAIETIMGSGIGGRKVTENQAWAGFAFNALPFMRFKSMQDVVCWTDQIWETTLKTWSLDRIETEWHTRIEFILNYMETK